MNILRNVFDQFSQPENRLSHALATTLSVNPGLCREFLGWVTGSRPPPKETLLVEQQRLPGRLSGDKEVGDDSGLPDMCIHSGGDWCIAFENKVGAALDRDQLRRHRKTMEQRFETVELVAITADPSPKALPNDVTHKTWVDIYTWLGQQINNHSEQTDFWCRQQRDYMRVFQATELANDYEMRTPITTFDGIPFGPDYPYSYKEAKLLLRQAITDLRKRLLKTDLGTNPKCTGRPAITGTDDSIVWDLISIRPERTDTQFTNYPHVTLGIGADHVDSMITMPNSMKADFNKNLRKLGKDGFRDMSDEIALGMEKRLGKEKGYVPTIRIVQRHCRAMRIATIDGEMEFDLRVGTGDPSQNIKSQPAWLDMAFELATNSKDANVQMQIGCVFPNSFGLLQGKDALDLIEASLVSCQPLIDVLFGRRG